MKDYLNAEEVLDVVVIAKLMDFADKMILEWGDRKNLTKDELKALRYVSTYSNKFFLSLQTRLSEPERKKILKRADKNYFQVVDEFMKKRIEQKLKRETDKVVFSRDEFDNFCCEIFAVRCNGCTNHSSKCDMYILMDDNFAPESSFNLPNCKYAYK